MVYTLEEAKKKLMDYVAVRAQSETEIREKLARFCDAETLELTVQWAQQKKWLTSPEELVRTKWQAGAFDGLNKKEAQKLLSKITRFLAARGFELEMINQVLKNEFNKSLNDGEEIYDEEF